VSEAPRNPYHLDDPVLWRAVARTIEDVLVPCLEPGHELDTAVQLIGLATHAATRPADTTDERSERLWAALGGADGSAHPDAYTAASAALLRDIEDTGRPDGSPTGAAVHEVLRGQLDADIAATAPLLETFSGHPATDVTPVERRIPEQERHALQTWLADALDGPVRVRRAVAMSGGHSRRMLQVTCEAPDGHRELVVRAEQGGIFATEGTTEARAMLRLRQLGFPVPEVLGIERSSEVLGQPFFVMTYDPGRNAADERLLAGFVTWLDELHHIAPLELTDALGPPPRSPEAAVVENIRRWTTVYRAATPTPIPLMDAAAAWLERHLRPTGELSVVHGDPGPGNVLGDDGRVSALIDWEFVHFGDPAEDWAYLTAIRGRKVMDRDTWREYLRRTVDVQYPERMWLTWEAFNHFKGACANLTTLDLLRRGEASTPNLLAIGTAIHLRFLRDLTGLIGRISADHA
jgi:aminoglycoside phosphotransferase (APT) family kinase protein